jgi:hypothetical protein
MNTAFSKIRDAITIVLIVCLFAFAGALAFDNVSGNPNETHGEGAQRR